MVMISMCLTIVEWTTCINVVHYHPIYLLLPSLELHLHFHSDVLSLYILGSTQFCINVNCCCTYGVLTSLMRVYLLCQVIDNITTAIIALYKCLLISLKACGTSFNCSLVRGGWIRKLNPHIFVSSYQRTPLHIAAAEGHVDIVVYLVKNGADINMKDKKGVGVTNLLVVDYNTDGKCLSWSFPYIICLILKYTGDLHIDQ